VTREEFIAALRKQGISAANAITAANEIERAGRLPQASDQLVTDLANAYKRNTGPSASTPANVALTTLEKYEQVWVAQPKAPAPRTNTPQSGAKYPRTTFQNPVKPRAPTKDEIAKGAWAIVNGAWPGTVTPPKEFVTAADQIRNFLASLNGGGDVGADVLDPYAELMSLLTDTGGSGPRGGGAGTGVEDNPVDTPEEIDAFVRRAYGGFMVAYLQNPEIGPILRQAATEGWDEARLQGALSNTEWWKNTSATARVFDGEKQMDPATMEAKIQGQLEAIRRQASLLGLQIQGKVDLGGFGSYDRDYYLAVQSLREGWTPTHLAQAIFNEAGFDPNAAQGTGQVKATADEVRALSADYFLPISDAAANQYSKQILLGTLDLDSLEGLFRTQAEGRFPGLSEQIKKGIKPKQFFDTYQQQIAGMLEIDPEQVDLMSAKWMPVVDAVGTDGVRRPMTMAETADYVRKTPEWDKTDGAMQSAMQGIEALGRTFGKVG
jgi:hypothetical protein